MTIIAPHQKGFGTRAETRAKAATLRFAFSVPWESKVPGAQGGGIPHCFLFDHTGKCVFDGHPDKVEEPLRAAMGALWLSGRDDAKTNKSLAPTIAMLKTGKNPAAAVKKLTTSQNSIERDEAKEATALLNMILGPNRTALERATKLAETNPVAAYDVALVLESAHRGTALGRQATQLISKLKNHRTVSAETKARALLVAVENIDDQLDRQIPKKGPKPDKAEIQKKFAVPLKELQTVLRRMKQSYPDAIATRDAMEIAKRYDVVVLK